MIYILHLFLQADCEPVKINIHCHVVGDVVLECISLDSNLERELMVFRIMFNTAFIRSNSFMLNRDEIDILWNTKDQFPKDFSAEVCNYIYIYIYMSSFFLCFLSCVFFLFLLGQICCVLFCCDSE